MSTAEVKYRGIEMPESTADAIKAYIVDHCPVHKFLYHVLANNLLGAITHGDMEELAALPAIVIYAYNEVPSKAYGSPEKVDSWMKGVLS